MCTYTTSPTLVYNTYNFKLYIYVSKMFNTVHLLFNLICTHEIYLIGEILTIILYYAYMGIRIVNICKKVN